MFRWIDGRQGSGYKKFCILSLVNFDIYLLKFPTGCSVPAHKDVVLGKTHHRFNAWLIRPVGGAFWTSTTMYGIRRYYGWKRFNKFRPDIQWHGIHECFTTGYMLSIGWTKNEIQLLGGHGRNGSRNDSQLVG